MLPQAFKAQFNLPLKFWIIALIAFINSVSLTIIIPILYPYAKEFGLSDFQASLLLTAYSVSQFLATPVLGRLSDVVGRKPLLVLSLLGTVLANLVASFTPFAWLFFGARILDGLTGGNNSIAQAVLIDTTEPIDRPKAFGLFDAAFRLGFVTGPVISYLAQKLPPLPGISPLGMSFLAGAIIALVAVGLTWFLLPETLSQPSTRMTWSWQMFGFGKILGSAIAPKIGPLFLLTFLSGATFTVFAFAFQPFFLRVLHQDAASIAIVFTLVGVVGVLTQLFGVDPITRKFNLIDILFVAIALRALIFLGIPVLPSVGAFLGLISFMGFVNSFPMPIISALLSVNSPEQKQGEVQGINASYLSVSNAVGPVLSGWFLHWGYAAPFWIAGILTLLTAAFALQLKSVLACKKPRPV